MNTATAASLDGMQLRELVSLRESMVERHVQAHINRLQGDVSNEQVETWEREAYRRWRETYPALSQIFPSVES